MGDLGLGECVGLEHFPCLLHPIGMEIADGGATAKLLEASQKSGAGEIKSLRQVIDGDPFRVVKMQIGERVKDLLLVFSPLALFFIFNAVRRIETLLPHFNIPYNLTNF